jgi:hypothetical protein
MRTPDELPYKKLFAVNPVTLVVELVVKFQLEAASLAMLMAVKYKLVDGKRAVTVKEVNVCTLMIAVLLLTTQ